MNHIVWSSNPEMESLMVDGWYLLIAVSIACYLVITIRFIPKDRRCAVITRGEFVKLVMPGLRLKLSGKDTTWMLLTVGDRGKFEDHDHGLFRGARIPVSTEGEIRTGDRVKIRAFGDNQVVVVRDPGTVRSFVCVKPIDSRT
jgi:hypothetical protein